MKSLFGLFLAIGLAFGATGCTGSGSAISSTEAEVTSVSSTEAEEALRSSLFDSTGYLFLTGCPDDMSGSEGAVFTCYACPQDYAAVDFDEGKYFYGDSSDPWRCDAAGEGFAVDYQVTDGEMILMNSSTRAAN